MVKKSPSPPAHLATAKSSWLFVLGREPLLSAAEISAVFSLRQINYQIANFTANNLILTLDRDIVTAELIKTLGGTIKIAKKIDITQEGVAYFLNHYLPQGKINFSLNGFDKKDGIEIKKQLRAMGRGARYVEAKNTATTLFNNLIHKGAELTKINGQIFITQALQPFQEFGKRDYGRPKRDDRSGMLPPKLAMMMINLATQPTHANILDPFCGSGTIVTEAILLGYQNIIGADISAKAVADSQKNIEWTLAHHTLPTVPRSLQILLSDVHYLSDKIKNNSVEAIVTEPLLGKPLTGRETMEETTQQAKELKKLYLSAFQQFTKIVKTEGIVIFVIPCFRLKNNWIKIDCSTEIKKLGWEPVSLWENKISLLYSRPDQYVGREIWKFIKINPTLRQERRVSGRVF